MNESHGHPSVSTNETARVEAFSDGVFAIAITLLILEIKVPPLADHEGLGHALIGLWPSYLAYLASFATIGVMWLNHHRLFTLIVKNDDGVVAFNLALLLLISWMPFPTALLAEHLHGPDSITAGVVYAGSFFIIAIIFNLMWRYAVKAKAVAAHLDVESITRQYALGPVMYAGLVAAAFINGTVVLIVSALYAVYFALPPKLWRRR
jgi:uncharacterized membrane protein